DEKRAPREENTPRKARIAENMRQEADAIERSQKIMFNLADAIEKGEAVHLDGISAITHIETLDRIISDHFYNKYGRTLPYGEWLKKKEQGATIEDIADLEYPKPVMHIDWLKKLYEKTEGLKG